MLRYLSVGNESLARTSMSTLHNLLHFNFLKRLENSRMKTFEKEFSNICKLTSVLLRAYTPVPLVSFKLIVLEEKYLCKKSLLL